MAQHNPPIKGAQYIFYIGLRDQSNTKILKSNPTIASGDFKVSIDGGALANPATLPAVTPASSKAVKVTLSASEMNGDNITFIGSDASGNEWCDVLINIQTTTVFPADTVQISGDSTAADNAESFFDGTGYAGTNNVIPTVGAVSGAVGSVTGNVGGSVNSVVGSVGGSVGSVAGSVGGNIIGNVQGSIGSLGAQAKADVNAEVVDALGDFEGGGSDPLENEVPGEYAAGTAGEVLGNLLAAIEDLFTDTARAETADIPAANAPWSDKWAFIASYLRNKKVFVDATGEESLYADDGSTVIGTRTTSDDGSTATVGEWVDAT